MVFAPYLKFESFIFNTEAAMGKDHDFHKILKISLITALFLSSLCPQKLLKMKHQNTHTTDHGPNIRHQGLKKG